MVEICVQTCLWFASLKRTVPVTLFNYSAFMQIYFIIAWANFRDSLFPQQSVHIAYLDFRAASCFIFLFVFMKDGGGNQNSSENKLVLCWYRSSALKYFVMFHSWHK